MTDTTDHDRYLTLTVAASLAHRSERTLWRWIRRGQLGVVRVAGRTYVAPDELERVLTLKIVTPHPHQGAASEMEVAENDGHDPQEGA